MIIKMQIKATVITLHPQDGYSQNRNFKMSDRYEEIRQATADLGSFLDLLSVMPQAFLASQGKRVN